MIYKNPKKYNEFFNFFVTVKFNKKTFTKIKTKISNQKYF